jgi:hypothetical protein
MQALMHAHSGLRYLVLLVALAHLVMSLIGLTQSKPFAPIHRALSAAFLGLLHTQVLIGIVQVLMGVYYPRLIGHIVLMLAAAAWVTVQHVRNKRANPPSHRTALISTLVALGLIVAGIAAIGRHPFQALSLG